MKSCFLTLPLLSIAGVITSTAQLSQEWHRSCHVWPPNGGQPVEHRDSACDRAAQNAALNAQQAVADAAPKENLVPDAVYLRLPEEKTVACPMDSEMEGDASDMVRIDPNRGGLGHHTKWILYNEASTPIILSHVNALGLEVSAVDHSTYPVNSNTAVYPHGPILLPGGMAAVEGRQGQTFVAREYREMTLLDAMHHPDQASFDSFRSVLPRTLSGNPSHVSRFETAKSVVHVLGRVGRVLMKHQMGNVVLRNQYGASCPMVGMGKDDEATGRGSPRDTNPDCNVLRKSFINKVGCPVDVYFAPQNRVGGFNCERFSHHLGSLDSYLVRADRHIDSPLSPLKFENTYNGHSFVVRMAHDQSLVARIEFSHDAVRDCPEPKKSVAGIDLPAGERSVENTTVPAVLGSEWLAAAMSNATDRVIPKIVCSNATVPSFIPEIVHQSKDRGSVIPSTLVS